MDEELVCEVQLCGGVLGYHQQAAGILVYAVHQHAHPLVFHIGGEVQVIRQGVYQRAVVIAVAGVHHHAGGLVHHQYVVVFVGYVQGDVLRENLGSPALIGHHKLHHIPGAHDVIGLHGLFVHQHVAQLDGLLHAVAGGVLLVVCDVFVYADGLLPLVYVQAKMLEHFVGDAREYFLGHFLAGSLDGSRVR